MSFNPLDAAPAEQEEKAAAKGKRSREDELIESIFVTPQGRELLNIWKDKLVYAPVWNAVQPNEVCRHIGGRHSVYRDIITIAERKKP